MSKFPSNGIIVIVKYTSIQLNSLFFCIDIVNISDLEDILNIQQELGAAFITIPLGVEVVLFGIET